MVRQDAATSVLPGRCVGLHLTMTLTAQIIFRDGTPPESFSFHRAARCGAWCWTSVSVKAGAAYAAGRGVVSWWDET